MTRNRRATTLAVLLAVLAGGVDAMGFLHLHGAFVSFMSGNSTRLGVALAGGQGRGAAVLAAIVGLFVLGAMLGAVVDRVVQRRRRAAVLATVTLLLLAAAAAHAMGFDRLAVAAMALATGAENAVFLHDRKVSVGLTYVTGALVKTAHGLVASLCGGPLFGWLPDFLLWAGLVCGAVAGSMLYASMALEGLWAAALLALLVTLWVLAEDRHLGDAP